MLKASPFGGAFQPRNAQQKMLTLPFQNMFVDTTPLQNISPCKRPMAQKKYPPDLHGTVLVPFQTTFVEDEDATFQTIISMEFYANKSPKELRTEDYQCNPGNLVSSKGSNCVPNVTKDSISETKAVALSRTNEPVDPKESKCGAESTEDNAKTAVVSSTYKPMDCESLQDDMETAMFLVNNFHLPWRMI